jgi:hypothetical protein
MALGRYLTECKKEEFEDTKGVIRIHIEEAQKRQDQEKGQNDNQQSTKHRKLKIEGHELL